MGDERESFCDLTVLFRIQGERLLSQNVPGRLIAKSRSRTLIADCSIPPPLSSPCQLCRLLPAPFHTCCFFTSVSSAEEAAGDIPPSHQVMWSGDSAGELERTIAETRSSENCFDSVSFFFPLPPLLTACYILMNRGFLINAHTHTLECRPLLVNTS